MKKTQLIILLFLTLLPCSCQKTEAPKQDTEVQEKESALPQSPKKEQKEEDQADVVDDEFIAVMKTLSIYDPAIAGSAEVVLNDFEKRYTGREAQRVLDMARRIWIPDPDSGALVRADGFAKAGGHTFRFKRGSISQEDQAVIKAYARYLTAPKDEQKNLKKSFPTENISEHLRAIIKSSP